MAFMRSRLFSRQRAVELAAVNLFSDRAEVGHIRRNGSERPGVDVFAQFPHPSDPVVTLQRLPHELHLEPIRCSTLLPAPQYQLQLLYAPDVPHPHMNSA